MPPLASSICHVPVNIGYGQPMQDSKIVSL